MWVVEAKTRRLSNYTIPHACTLSWIWNQRKLGQGFVWQAFSSPCPLSDVLNLKIEILNINKNYIFEYIYEINIFINCIELLINYINELKKKIKIATNIYNKNDKLMIVIELNQTYIKREFSDFFLK